MWQKYLQSMLGCRMELQICANDANDVGKCLNEAQNLLKLSQQFAELSVSGLRKFSESYANLSRSEL